MYNNSSSNVYHPYQQLNESSSSSSNSNSSNSNYLGFFDAYSPIHSHPPPNYLYPPLPLPLPPLLLPPPPPPLETTHWSMNSYRSDFHDAVTTSYYGYHLNHALPITEINRRTWEYSSSMHIQEPTVDMQSQLNLVAASDGADDCPVEHSDTASPEAAWEDNIDPDNMTYEELLNLGEAVGTHNRGLSQELIKLLPTSRYKAGSFFLRKKSRERCVICLVTYKIGDQQMRLPCKHVYHSKCGRKWLSINKTCPVCNSQVYGDESRT